MRSTLIFRLRGKFTKKEKGPKTTLTKEEESTLIKRINDCHKKGFPRRKEDVLLSVQEFLNVNKRETPFTNNYPGRGWYRS